LLVAFVAPTFGHETLRQAGRLGSTSTTRTRLSSTGSSPRPSTGPTSRCACARRRPSPTNRAPVCRSMRAGPPASRCVCVCACVTQPGVHALRYGCADSVPLRWYGSRGAGQRSWRPHGFRRWPRGSEMYPFSCKRAVASRSSDFQARVPSCRPSLSKGRTAWSTRSVS